MEGTRNLPRKSWIVMNSKIPLTGKKGIFKAFHSSDKTERALRGTYKELKYRVLVDPFEYFESDHESYFDHDIMKNSYIREELLTGMENIQKWMKKSTSTEVDIDEEKVGDILEFLELDGNNKVCINPHSFKNAEWKRRACFTDSIRQKHSICYNGDHFQQISISDFEGKYDSWDDFENNLRENACGKVIKMYAGDDEEAFEPQYTEKNRFDADINNKEQFARRVLGKVNMKSYRRKSEMCRCFQDEGCCKFGYKCQYNHGFGDEVSCIQWNPSSSHVPHHHHHRSSYSSYQTRPCCHYYGALGFCPYGVRCTYLHSLDSIIGYIVAMDITCVTLIVSSSSEHRTRSRFFRLFKEQERKEKKENKIILPMDLRSLFDPVLWDQCELSRKLWNTLKDDDDEDEDEEEEEEEEKKGKKKKGNVIAIDEVRFIGHERCCFNGLFPFQRKEVTTKWTMFDPSFLNLSEIEEKRIALIVETSRKRYDKNWKRIRQLQCDLLHSYFSLVRLWVFLENGKNPKHFNIVMALHLLSEYKNRAVWMGEDGFISHFWSVRVFLDLMKGKEHNLIRKFKKYEWFIERRLSRNLFIVKQRWIESFRWLHECLYPPSSEMKAYLEEREKEKEENMLIISNNNNNNKTNDGKSIVEKRRKTRREKRLEEELEQRERFLEFHQGYIERKIEKERKGEVPKELPEGKQVSVSQHFDYLMLSF